MNKIVLPKSLISRANEALALIPNNAIYFAHPVNYYEGSKFNKHTNKESELIEIITSTFPEYTVYNPNQPHNQINYSLWKEKLGSGMKYYFDIILPNMEAGIALSFEDGMIGAGAFGEIQFLMNRNKLCYEISPKGIIKKISNLDFSKQLSIEETRKRVYSKN